jgi:hypothetical protein
MISPIRPSLPHRLGRPGQVGALPKQGGAGGHARAPRQETAGGAEREHVHGPGTGRGGT